MMFKPKTKRMFAIRTAQYKQLEN